MVFTRHGAMGNYVSNLRPLLAPIFAFVPTIEVCRKMTLNWGTYPLLLAFDPNPNRTIGAAERVLLDRGLVKSGDRLVIISDLLAGEKLFDSIQVRIVE